MSEDTQEQKIDKELIDKELKVTEEWKKGGRRPRLVCYDGGEHSLILDELPEGIPSEVVINGFSIHLKDIICLPDFYSSHVSVEDAFFKYYDTIAHPQNFKKEPSKDIFLKDFVLPFNLENRKSLEKTLKLLASEREGLKKLREENKQPGEYYTNGDGKDLNKKYVEALGPNYILVSLFDFDHFQPDALTAYRTARDQAFELAEQAHKEQNEKQKKALFDKACAYLAYGLHFFTDAFAAGHVVTPHFELVKEHGLVLGGLLTKASHDEANSLGINCQDKEGNERCVFGDAKLFDLVNEKNYKAVVEACQSVFKDLKDIYDGLLPLPLVHPEESAMPEPLPSAQQKTCCPLFHVDEESKKVFRRKEVGNPLCEEYIENWYGVSTLIECCLHASKSNPAPTVSSSFFPFLCCFANKQQTWLTESMGKLESLYSLFEEKDKKILNTIEKGLKKKYAETHDTVKDLLDRKIPFLKWKASLEEVLSKRENAHENTPLLSR